MQRRQEIEVQQLFSSITNQSDRQYVLSILRKIAADQERPIPKLTLIVGGGSRADLDLLRRLG